MDTLFNCDNEGEPYIEEPGASLLDSSIFSTVTDINDSDASNGVAARGMYDDMPDWMNGPMPAYSPKRFHWPTTPESQDAFRQQDLQKLFTHHYTQEKAPRRKRKKTEGQLLNADGPEQREDVEVAPDDLDLSRPFEVWTEVPIIAYFSWLWTGMGRGGPLKKRITDAAAVELAEKHGWDLSLRCLGLWVDDAHLNDFNGVSVICDAMMRDWNDEIAKNSHRRQNLIAIMGTKSKSRTLNVHHKRLSASVTDLHGKRIHFIPGPRIASCRVEPTRPTTDTCAFTCGIHFDDDGYAVGEDGYPNSYCGSCEGPITFLPPARFHAAVTEQDEQEPSSIAHSDHESDGSDDDDEGKDRDAGPTSAIREEIVGADEGEQICSVEIASSILVGDMAFLNEGGTPYDLYSNAPRAAINSLASFAAVGDLEVNPAYVRYCKRAAENAMAVAAAETRAKGNVSSSSDEGGGAAAGGGGGSAGGGGSGDSSGDDAAAFELDVMTRLGTRVHNGTAPTPGDVAAVPFKAPIVVYDRKEYDEQEPSKENKFGKRTHNSLDTFPPAEKMWESAHCDHSQNQSCNCQRILRRAEVKGPKCVKLWKDFAVQSKVHLRINSAPGASKDEMKMKFHFQRTFYKAFIKGGPLGPPEFGTYYSDDELASMVLEFHNKSMQFGIQQCDQEEQAHVFRGGGINANLDHFNHMTETASGVGGDYISRTNKPSLAVATQVQAHRWNLTHFRHGQGLAAFTEVGESLTVEQRMAGKNHLVGKAGRPLIPSGNWEAGEQAHLTAKTFHNLCQGVVDGNTFRHATRASRAAARNHHTIAQCTALADAIQEHPRTNDAAVYEKKKKAEKEATTMTSERFVEDLLAGKYVPDHFRRSVCPVPHKDDVTWEDVAENARSIMKLKDEVGKAVIASVEARRSGKANRTIDCQKVLVAPLQPDFTDVVAQLQSTRGLTKEIAAETWCSVDDEACKTATRIVVSGGAIATGTPIADAEISIALYGRAMDAAGTKMANVKQTISILLTEIQSIAVEDIIDEAEDAGTNRILSVLLPARFPTTPPGGAVPAFHFLWNGIEYTLKLLRPQIVDMVSGNKTLLEAGGALQILATCDEAAAKAELEQLATKETKLAAARGKQKAKKGKSPPKASADSKENDHERIKKKHTRLTLISYKSPEKEVDEVMHDHDDASSDEGHHDHDLRSRGGTTSAANDDDDGPAEPAEPVPLPVAVPTAIESACTPQKMTIVGATPIGACGSFTMRVSNSKAAAEKHTAIFPATSTLSTSFSSNGIFAVSFQILSGLSEIVESMTTILPSLGSKIVEPADGEPFKLSDAATAGGSTSSGLGGGTSQPANVGVVGVLPNAKTSFAWKRYHIWLWDCVIHLGMPMVVQQCATCVDLLFYCADRSKVCYDRHNPEDVEKDRYLHTCTFPKDFDYGNITAASIEEGYANAQVAEFCLDDRGFICNSCRGAWAGATTESEE